MEEIWKDIEGYEGNYQVSSLGRVRSLDRHVNHHKGGKKIVHGKILNPFINWDGYIRVELSKLCSKKKFFIHRLVADSFIPNPENKPEVNHKNGIKSDNFIENLEWMTSSENQKHSFSNGLQVALKGENHPFAKLSEETVFQIKYGKFDGISHSEIAKIFGVKRLQVLKIRNGINWKHI